MQGIITLLDNEQYEFYFKLIKKMVRSLRLPVNYNEIRPHFTYHMAERYDVEALLPLLAQLTAQTAPFAAKVSGLGVFPGRVPVVSALVVRTRALTAWHHKIWTAAEPLGIETRAYYHPDLWIPHITLGDGNLERERLADVMNWLNDHDQFEHDIVVNNVTYIPADRDKAIRFDFTGSSF